MSFMNRLNETVKRKQQVAAPKSQSAKLASTNHSYTQGKSRVQGAEGMGQGSQGWQSQYGGNAGQNKQVNPLINSLSSKPSYETPKITKSLLTQDGFNQALGVVGASNNAKLDMQNRKVLQGVLGSVINGDSQNRATAMRHNVAGMNNDTKRRGQDLDATAKAEAQAEASSRNKTLGNYYDGQNAIGEERNSIAREKLNMPTQPKALNPLDEKIKRQKILSDGGLEGILGSEMYNSLSSEQQTDIAGKYTMTGELPTGMKQVGGNEEYWDSREYEPSYGNSQQSQGSETTQQTKHEAKIPQATGALFDRISSGLGIDRGSLKLSDDGQSIVLPDGRKSLVSLLTEKYGSK